MSASTEGEHYADRLIKLQTPLWKRVLPVQAPYRWNLRRLRLGRTLDIGCGIGRNIVHLHGNAVGVDHNPDLVAYARSRGLTVYTIDAFPTSPSARLGSFDALLFSHVIEHVAKDDVAGLVQTYLPYIRPGGRIVFITPQERGFRSDPTHVVFADADYLVELAAELGLTVERNYSFPFPRSCGRAFVYNEFVVVAHKPGDQGTTK